MAQPTKLTAARADGRRMFRCIRGEQTDWRSNYECDVKPRGPEVTNTMIHMGLSVWTTLDHVRSLNSRIKNPFPEAALVELRGEEGIWLARTFGPGHYTIWVRPDTLQRCVISVVSLL